MKWAAAAGAVMLTIAPALAAQQPPATTASTGTTGMVTLRGCVTPGAGKDAYVLTGAQEVTQGKSALPAEAQGRRVVFWLDDEQALARHSGKLVEVRGTLGKVEESAVELKAGMRKDGGLIVEFERPGKDDVASADTPGKPVGTTGSVTPQKNDGKTFLVPVKINDVRTVETACR